MQSRTDDIYREAPEKTQKALILVLSIMELFAFGFNLKFKELFASGFNVKFKKLFDSGFTLKFKEFFADRLLF